MDKAQIKSRLAVLMDQRGAARADSSKILEEASTEDGSGNAPGLTGALLERYEASDKIVGSTSSEIEALETELKWVRKDSEVVEERVEESGTPTEEYGAAFERWARSTNNVDLREPGDAALLNERAQSVGTDSAGGYLVPDTFEARLREALKAFGGAASVVHSLVTATGATLPWPTNDDTANEGAILAENTQIAEQDVSFGVRSIGSYTYTSKLVKTSWQLMQDSTIDLEGLLVRALATRLGRITNKHLTTGTGTAQPTGLVTGVTLTKTAAAASAIAFDDLVGLQHTIDPAYRNSNAVWMFSDTVLEALRKIRDDSGGAGLGRPIWEPSVQVGEPSRILGNPYILNQAMSQAITTGNMTVLYGDFDTAYIHRSVKGIQIVRMDERYADFLQTGWFGFLRQDGGFDDSNAVAGLEQA